jgi:hypothetical protein
MADLFVDVRKEHIVAGSCKIAQRCMIALAIKDHHPTVSYVSVRTNGITITKRRRDGKSVRQHWAVPMKVAKAIIAFDNDQPVKPFSFHAKLIDEVPIKPVDPEQRAKDAAQTRKRRDKLKRIGIKLPKYGPRGRVAGV